MITLVKRVIADEAGASTAEYAILLAAVGAAAVAAVAVFGGGLSSMFTTLSTKMGSWVS